MSDSLIPLTVTPKTKEALGHASPWIRFMPSSGLSAWESSPLPGCC